MLITGAFGGVVNYLHSFDVNEPDSEIKNKCIKYILSGICASFLVPAFLKMIASNLITNPKDEDYLVFIGFCLIAAIFSRKFIFTIGERILEQVKKVEKVANKNKEKTEQLEVKIDDVEVKTDNAEGTAELALTATQINRSNQDAKATSAITDEQENAKLKNLIKQFDNEISNILNEDERVKRKKQLGNLMGDIIVRHDVDKNKLYADNKSEGSAVAIAYAIQLKPKDGDLELLNQIGENVRIPFTKHQVINAYRNYLKIFQDEGATKLPDIEVIISKFKSGADKHLLDNIKELESTLSFIRWMK
jgi:hypothetical protein